MKTKQGFFLPMLLLMTVTALANAHLPVIKATSRTVDIRDGKHLRKGYWSVMPERCPDHYYVELPQVPQIVTFITDQDSISFQVSYNHDYDFVILLNGKDSCYTRISTRYHNFNPAVRNSIRPGPDTIPFQLGENHKIYVDAWLNGRLVKNNQLDLGAGGTVINTTSVKKVRINFDAKTNLANSDGVHKVPFATKNMLRIGNLHWDSVSVVAAANMEPHEDLIIGNSLFKNRILEIDYDRKILVIHRILPFKAKTYTRHDMILDGGVIPYIQATLTTNGKSKKGWAMFDTGARTTIVNEADFPSNYRLMVELISLLGLCESRKPEIRLNDYRNIGFEYKVRKMDGAGLSMVLGSDLLKRYNLIFDNQTGTLYMRTNSLMNNPYRHRFEYYLIRVILSAVTFVLLVLVYKKRKKSLIS